MEVLIRLIPADLTILKFNDEIDIAGWNNFEKYGVSTLASYADSCWFALASLPIPFDQVEWHNFVKKRHYPLWLLDPVSLLLTNGLTTLLVYWTLYVY